MQATKTLMEEHQVIIRVLKALEKAATRLNNREPVSHGFFLDTAEFAKGFADGCHHKKEEGVLFPAMVKAGLPADSGPIAVMLAEHEEGRRFTRAIRQAAEKMGSGDEAASADIVTNAFGYIKLLKQHIQKEDFILFPMADKIIPMDQQSQVNDEFERIEQEETGEGVHDRFLALAERLEIAALQ